MTMKCMAGIDLHSNNLFCAIVDMDGKRIFEKRLPCHLESVLAALKPFKRRLEKIAVESTYNWYWLVDGLQDHGYPVVLANPAAMEQYNGLKHADDKSDGFFLAEMLRLKILPTGNICDRAVRPVRDLLRRRIGLVHKRTSLILSLKSLHTRMTGRAGVACRCRVPVSRAGVACRCAGVVPVSCAGVGSHFLHFVLLCFPSLLLFKFSPAGLPLCPLCSAIPKNSAFLAKLFPAFVCFVSFCKIFWLRLHCAVFFAASFAASASPSTPSLLIR